MDIREYVRGQLNFARQYAVNGEVELVKMITHQTDGAVEFYWMEHMYDPCESHEAREEVNKNRDWWENEVYPLFLNELRTASMIERV